MIDWPFVAPDLLTVHTQTPILSGRAPVLLVRHDLQGRWHFLTNGSIAPTDHADASFLAMMQLDPTLRALAQLPRGWRAHREHRHLDWRASPESDAPTQPSPQ